MNKNLVITSSIFLIVIPIFGINFLLNFLGNILLLVFLVPILILLIALISFNFLKSKVNTCNECGSISLGVNNTCMNCGADMNYESSDNSGTFKEAGETTIEVKAEEIK